MTRSELIREIAYRRAGGGQKDTFTNVTNVIGALGQGYKTVMEEERLKKEQEQKRLKDEQDRLKVQEDIKTSQDKLKMVGSIADVTGDQFDSEEVAKQRMEDLNRREAEYLANKTITETPISKPQQTSGGFAGQDIVRSVQSGTPEQISEVEKNILAQQEFDKKRKFYQQQRTNEDLSGRMLDLYRTTPRGKESGKESVDRYSRPAIELGYSPEYIKNEFKDMSDDEVYTISGRQLREKLQSKRTGIREGNIANRFETRTIKDYVSDFNNDPEYKTVKTQRQAANKLQEFLLQANKGNEVAFATASTMAAKQAGEVGMLSESDVTRYAQAKSIPQATLDKIKLWVKGRPSDSTIQDLNEVSNGIKDILNAREQELIDVYSNQMSENLGIERGKARRYFGFEEKKDTGGVPKVGGTFNGAKVLSVEEIR